jgi:hypothetical protein
MILPPPEEFRFVAHLPPLERKVRARLERVNDPLGDAGRLVPFRGLVNEVVGQ